MMAYKRLSRYARLKQFADATTKNFWDDRRRLVAAGTSPRRLAIAFGVDSLKEAFWPFGRTMGTIQQKTIQKANLDSEMAKEVQKAMPGPFERAFVVTPMMLAKIIRLEKGPACHA